MKIAIFSMSPVFQDIIHSGAQKILREVSIHLGQCGHTVTVLCTKRSDNANPFKLGTGVTVLPVLPFKQTYPQPYEVPPYQLATAILELRKVIEASDVLYLHESQLLYDFVRGDVPTVASFRDFVYPETLSCALSFRGDRLILNSRYTQHCVEDVFASFCPGIRERTRYIPNGVDLGHFNARKPGSLVQGLNLPRDSMPILYPHRPDPRKGIFECLEVLAKLRRLDPATAERVRLLIPLYVDNRIAQDSSHVYQTLYGTIEKRAEVLGIRALIQFHDWVPYNLLPEYYSCGAVTMCIGNFVETCSNVCLESLACGTPCVVANVGCHRTLIPDELAARVDFGDSASAASAVAQLLRQPRKTAAARDFLNREHNYDRMLSDYEETIVTTTALPRLSETYRTDLKTDEILDLPAWCYVRNGRIFNDYTGQYQSEDNLFVILDRVGLPATVDKILQESATTQSRLTELVAEGMLCRTMGPRNRMGNKLAPSNASLEEACSD
jgi:glycosyltransferase involved in cell wall biosynthesis